MRVVGSGPAGSGGREIQDPGIVTEPDQLHRGQIDPRIHDRLMGAAIEGDGGPGSDAGAAVGDRFPLGGHPARVAP